MVIKLIKYVVFWFNSPPPKSGVSFTYSPSTILLEKNIYFNKHCKIMFGAYVQAHEDQVKTNTM